MLTAQLDEEMPPRSRQKLKHEEFGARKTSPPGWANGAPIYQLSSQIEKLLPCPFPFFGGIHPQLHSCQLRMPERNPAVRFTDHISWRPPSAFAEKEPRLRRNVSVTPPIRNDAGNIPFLPQKQLTRCIGGNVD